MIVDLTKDELQTLRITLAANIEACGQLVQYHENLNAMPEVVNAMKDSVVRLKTIKAKLDKVSYSVN